MSKFKNFHELNRALDVIAAAHPGLLEPRILRPTRTASSTEPPLACSYLTHATPEKKNLTHAARSLADPPVPSQAGQSPAAAGGRGSGGAGSARPGRELPLGSDRARLRMRLPGAAWRRPGI
jgi:hypothetical protein